MVATTAQQPFILARIPASSWSFAVRVWLATILALFVSFWLQLEAPATAAVTVGVLAEPTRGQALDKAGFRLMATIAGVTAAITITGLFSQLRDLMLAACAVWLGVCVFAARLLDGYRAYAAVLAGYTVAIIATQQIDNPQHVFQAGMERGAAIAVGIMSMALANAFLFAPERHSWLAAQLAALHRRVRAYASATFQREEDNSAVFLPLVREIVGLRPEIGSAALESSSGSIRSAAARNVAVGLLAQLQAARVIKPVPARSVDRQDYAPDVAAETSAWKTRELRRLDDDVRQELLALRSIKWPSRLRRAPLYLSYRNAAESGLRAALWFALAATFFVWTGWSAASASLSFLASIAALGAITPNPRGFTVVALFGAPISVALAGLLEFILLDGTDAFPVLALALAPFTIGSALLATSHNPMWSALGRINLFAIPTMLAPSNPETYNPQTFLFTSLFFVASIAILLVAQTLIPPISDEKQRMRLLAAARRELQEADNKMGADEATFREASRIGQFLSAGGAQDGRALADMLACLDQSAMIRLCNAKLIQVTDSALAPLAHQASAALATRNTATLRIIARVLREKAPHKASIEAETAACLVATSNAFDQDGLDSAQEAR